MLPDALCTKVALGFGHDLGHHLQVAKVYNLILVINLNAVVGGALVDSLNMGLFVHLNLGLDGKVVSIARLLAHVLVNLWILGENLANEELFGESKGLNRGLSDVNKLRFGVAQDVKVAEERVQVELVRNVERLVLKGLLVRVEAHPDGTLSDEVHLEDFVLLIVDNVLLIVVTVGPWNQSKGHIVQELTVLVFLGVEEKPEVVEDVIEKEVNDNGALDLAWQSSEEFVALSNIAKSIVLPVVSVMRVDLPVDITWNGLIAEP